MLGIVSGLILSLQTRTNETDAAEAPKKPRYLLLVIV